MAEANGEDGQVRDAEGGIYTETLARLYWKQGFCERALAIYRRLVDEQPGNHHLHERVHTLERELAAGLIGASPEALGTALHTAHEERPRALPWPEQEVILKLERWLACLQRQVRTSKPAEV